MEYNKCQLVTFDFPLTFEQDGFFAMYLKKWVITKFYSAYNFIIKFDKVRYIACHVVTRIVF